MHPASEHALQTESCKAWSGEYQSVHSSSGRAHECRLSRKHGHCSGAGSMTMSRDDRDSRSLLSATPPTMAVISPASERDTRQSASKRGVHEMCNGSSTARGGVEYLQASIPRRGTGPGMRLHALRGLSAPGSPPAVPSSTRSGGFKRGTAAVNCRTRIAGTECSHISP